MPTIKCQTCGAVHSISIGDFRAGVEYKTCAKCPKKKQGKVEEVGETKEAEEREFPGADENIVEVKKEKRGRKKRNEEPGEDDSATDWYGK